MSVPGADRLIVALDVERQDEAVRLRERVGDAAGLFKVGLELFSAAGPEAVRGIGARRCFLDLKLHDIPETVARTVKRLAALPEVALLTVHASGGRAMLERAVEAAGPDGPGILAVTVLTSLDVADLVATGCDPDLERVVLQRAMLAQAAGCRGVVASPREVRALRAALPAPFLIVTPGIRPSGGHTADQKRTATAAEAIGEGASHVVVGRPIRDAGDPRAAAVRLAAEIADAS